MRRKSMCAKIVPRFLLLACLLMLGLTGCSVEDAKDGAETKKDSNGKSGLSGEVQIDGSSTVAPVSSAMAEDFGGMHDKVRVTVGTSGTGGGFKKWIRGETDINDASRPIKQSEIDDAKKNGIEPLELKVAIDGISVVVHPENTWAKSMTVEQLKKLWEPNSTITKWSEIDPSWPDEIIKLYGPDTDSGTFDYFTEEIVGTPKSSRTDYTPSADDHMLVKGVSGSKYALGYFGYAYYQDNKDQVKAIGIAKDGGEPVEPSPETIESGQYTPLSRPLFLYVSKKSLEKPQVVEFLRFYLSDEGQNLVPEVGYISLNKSQVEAARKALEDAVKK